MENRCPKCNINLSDEGFKSIKNRNSMELSLDMLFGKCSYSNIKEEVNEDIRKGGCDLCGASIKDLVTNRLLYPCCKK